MVLGGCCGCCWRRRMSSEGGGGGASGAVASGAVASGVAVVELEAAGRVGLGEGPHWVDSEQALYFVDLLAGALHRLHPASGLHTHATPPADHAPCTLGFAVPVRRRPGLFVAGLGRRLALLRWDGRGATFDVVAPLGADVVADADDVRFNDGKADPTGRLWAGTMSRAIDRSLEQPVKGALFSLEGEGAVERVPHVGISNGLAWHDDVLYFVDSSAERVDAFDLEPASGALSGRRCVFDFRAHRVAGVPDGMTVDTAGNLWIACFGGFQVVCVDPREGRLVQRVALPAAQVTSVCWGGRVLDQLFVTTAAVRGEEVKPAAGRLFRVDGLAANGLLNDQALLPPPLQDLAP